MVCFENIVITSIERTCIACPASWYGQTSNGGEWYVRFRGGRLSFRYAESNIENDRDYLPMEYEVYSDDNYDEFDGHMDAYELRDTLESIGVSFDSVLPDSFYGGLTPDECQAHLLGDWFSRAKCSECDYSIDSDEVENFQYETYIPVDCPECGASVEVITEKPDRIKKWGENDGD